MIDLILKWNLMIRRSLVDHCDDERSGSFRSASVWKQKMATTDSSVSVREEVRAGIPSPPEMVSVDVWSGQHPALVYSSPAPFTCWDCCSPLSSPSLKQALEWRSSPMSACSPHHLLAETWDAHKKKRKRSKRKKENSQADAILTKQEACLI